MSPQTREELETAFDAMSELALHEIASGSIEVARLAMNALIENGSPKAFASTEGK